VTSPTLTIRSFPFLAGVLLLLAGCTAALPAPAGGDIILATTTSTQDSGLLEVLIPAFEQQSSYRVKPIAVGSGQALKMGETGNADVLLVHAPQAERQLMEAGYGLDRWMVMHNHFLIVGPPADPARVRSLDAVQAFQVIAQAGALFVSRGDDSGTHKMELNLWRQAGLPLQGSWYMESGQGMGATLRIASERRAYTLTDRASFLSLRSGLELEVFSREDPSLLNVYHVITIHPEKWPRVNRAGARAFAEFLVSREGQELITRFGADQYGEPLFIPDGGKSEADLGLE
jgi:tungstate transport system substrate-binding protein